MSIYDTAGITNCDTDGIPEGSTALLHSKLSTNHRFAFAAAFDSLETYQQLMSRSPQTVTYKGF
jgi:hypothetical protein